MSLLIDDEKLLKEYWRLKNIELNAYKSMMIDV